MIREMKQSDIIEVARIEADIFSDAWSEKSLMESLNQKHVKMIVAEKNLAIADAPRVDGYVIFYMAGEEGDIARVAVSLDSRRRGIADRLLENIWKFCEKTSICRVLLEVRESNDSAIQLYKKHGFEELGMRKNYYSDPLENGVIMEKQIDITTSNSEILSI